MLGPRALECRPVPHRAQSVEALEGFQAIGEPEVVQLADGTRGEAVAARLLPREPLPLDGEHATTALREPVRGGRAGRSRADDQHVIVRARSAARDRVHGAMITFAQAVPPTGGSLLGTAAARCADPRSSVVARRLLRHFPRPAKEPRSRCATCTCGTSWLRTFPTRCRGACRGSVCTTGTSPSRIRNGLDTRAG